MMAVKEAAVYGGEEGRIYQYLEGQDFNPVERVILKGRWRGGSER